MTSHIIQIPSLEALRQAADRFASLIGDNRIFAFHGSMGAGKTTFINALCARLGVTDEATGSPTFAIVNEYTRPGKSPIYHFDLYRIDDPAEALDFGIEDYFDSGNLCFIEWPDRIEPLLPHDTATVEIAVNPDDSRTIKLTLPS